MNKSRFVLALVFIGALLLSTVAIVSGGQDKVDVCHITGTHDFGDGEVPIGHVITIADPAYLAHIEHGDPPAHIEVQLPDGTWVCKASSEGKIVFITSESWRGNFGSVQNADTHCQGAAENGGLAANGEPIFRAWLSDSVNHAKDHALESSYQGMYIKPNGEIIAINNDDLLDGTLCNNINVNEYRDYIDSYQWVWTGTQADGSAALSLCNDWSTIYDSGVYGEADETTFLWTQSAGTGCGVWLHLYCIEQ